MLFMIPNYCREFYNLLCEFILSSNIISIYIIYRYNIINSNILRINAEIIDIEKKNVSITKENKQML